MILQGDFGVFLDISEIFSKNIEINFEMTVENFLMVANTCSIVLGLVLSIPIYLFSKIIYFIK